MWSRKRQSPHRRLRMCKDCLQIDETTREYVKLLSSVRLEKDTFREITLDQTIKDSTFMTLLRSKRATMSPTEKARTRNIDKSTPTWQYPARSERMYKQLITRKMKEYSDYAMPLALDNMDRWVREYDAIATADSIIMDEYSQEVDEVIEGLYANQQTMFVAEQALINAQLQGVASEVGTQNQVQFEKFQKVAIGVTFKAGEPWVDATVDTWVRNNRNLIRGMTSEYIKKFELTVSQGFQEGLASSQIKQNLRKMDTNMTKARASLLARDQVGKLNGIYTKNRMGEAGLSYYVWLTARDERVRATHKTMDSTVNKWADTGVYSRDNGKTFSSRPTAMSGAIPGSQIQCRCTSKPFLKEILGQIDKEET